jgi:hypothetical protein
MFVDVVVVVVVVVVDCFGICEQNETVGWDVVAPTVLTFSNKSRPTLAVDHISIHLWFTSRAAPARHLDQCTVLLSVSVCLFCR